MDRLREIAHGLERASSSSRVVITPSAARVHDRIWQYLPSFLHTLLTPLLPKEYLEENRRTIDFFYDYFGRDRITQVARRAGIDLQKKYDNALPLYKRDVRRLFVSMCDVRKEDIEQLMEEISARPARLRHLSPEASREIYHKLAGKRVADLMKQDIDLLYTILIPFTKLHHAFLNRTPKIHPYASGGDNSEKGIERRAFLLEQMRRSYSFQHCRTADDELDWQMRIIKRIVDEKMPVGVIIPHPHGYLEHRGVIASDGVFTLQLKAITEKTDSFRSLIVALCTRFRLRDSGWRSLRQICLRAIGAEGAVHIMPKIREALYDPKAGFVERDDERVDLLGFSLGGNVCERITTAHPDKIHRMTAVSPAGNDEGTIRAFAQRIKSRQPRPELHYVVGHDDPIPEAGDGHIGVGCDPSLVRIEHVTLVPKEREEEPKPDVCPPRPEAPTGLIEAFDRMFIRGFYGQHSREETAAPHHRFIVTNNTPEGQKAIQRLLDTKGDPRRVGWEQWRSWFHMGDKDLFYNELMQQST